MRIKNTKAMTIVIGLYIVNLIALTLLVNTLSFTGLKVILCNLSILLMSVFVIGFYLFSLNKIVSKKTIKFFKDLVIILNILVLALNISLFTYKFTINKITAQKETAQSYIISLKGSRYLDIRALNGVKVGVSSNKENLENYILPVSILNEFDVYKDVELVYYEDMNNAFSDLNDGLIGAVGVTSNYESAYSVNLRVRILALSGKEEIQITSSGKVNSEKTNVLMIKTNSLDGYFQAKSVIVMNLDFNNNKIEITDLTDTRIFDECTLLDSEIKDISLSGTSCTIDSLEKEGIDFDFYYKYKEDIYSSFESGEESLLDRQKLAHIISKTDKFHFIKNFFSINKVVRKNSIVNLKTKEVHKLINALNKFEKPKITYKEYTRKEQ